MPKRVYFKNELTNNVTIEKKIAAARGLIKIKYCT